MLSSPSKRAPAASPDWRLAYVPYEDVAAMWPVLEPFVAMACRKIETDLTPEFIHHAALERRLRLWLILDGDEPVAGFPVVELPDGTAEILTFGGSRMREWMPHIMPELASLAKAGGMNALRLDGRKGWERTMAPYGFKTLKRDGRTVTMDLVL